MLPYFITSNFSNGTIIGYANDADVGAYQIECVGIDDAGWYTVIPFTLTIKRNLILISLLLACYFACATCWDSDYNTCKTCKPGWFLLNAECVEICPDGYYHNTVNRTCEFCPAQCSRCTGSDHKLNC